MEVIKDILINLAANAVWAVGGLLIIYFQGLKKLYSCRYKGHPLKKIQGFDWSPLNYTSGESNTSKKNWLGCDLLLKKSFLFATTEQSFKKSN